MAILSMSLIRLAESYERLLFEGELRRRFSHHMAHVASERWLAVELAMLFNERSDEFGLPGWAAIVEKGVVDVSLIPPGTDPCGSLPPEAIFLELKLIGAEYWATTWAEVRADLAGKTAKKPRAVFRRLLPGQPLEPSRFQAAGEDRRALQGVSRGDTHRHRGIRSDRHGAQTAAAPFLWRASARMAAAGLLSLAGRLRGHGPHPVDHRTRPARQAPGAGRRCRGKSPN